MIALVHSLSCLGLPGNIIVDGMPACLLDKVLPDRAAQIGVIVFDSEPTTLTLRPLPRIITLQSDRVYVTQVWDVHEGQAGPGRAQ